MAPLAAVDGLIEALTIRWGFQDPAQLFHRDVFQNVERFTTSGNLNWTPLTWLAVRGTVCVP